MTTGGRAPESRAVRFLTEAAELLGRPELAAEATRAFVRATPDPDHAGLGIIRIAEAVAGCARTAELSTTMARPRTLKRLLTLTGYSEACTDFLVRCPQALEALSGDGERCLLGTAEADPAVLREVLFASVGADPRAAVPVAERTGVEAVNSLREAYRTLLIQLTADDLGHAEPTTIVREVSTILSDMAAAAIDTALAVARAELDPLGSSRLAIIAMGKCGARELNYVSDVDVVYCAEPVGMRETATALAMRTTEIIARPDGEPALWEIDAALRPEGKAGPLVRTFDEFLGYYQDTAENWEFQALLKGRPIAGDRELGEHWFAELNPLVWAAAGRRGFIDGVRAMRKRVVDLIPDKEADRQLKLGAGGLRDVEFSAQLLQLVHGAADPTIRCTRTLDLLPALAAGGYMASSDAQQLEDAYRFTRVVEHRLQIPRMHRSALLPVKDDQLRWLARAVYPAVERERTAERLLAERERFARRVRVLQEQIFYRPILQAAAGDSLVRMSTDAAKDRLRAFGYLDPNAAMEHIHALARGTARSALVLRQVLPAMLSWFTEGVNPDGGLLAFRRLSEALATTNWYLKMMRDSGVAAHNVARVLSLSAYATELLLKNPSAVAWLSDTIALSTEAEIDVELDGLLRRHGADANGQIRAVYGRELLRCALADVLDVVDRDEVPGRLSRIMDAAIAAVLRAVRRRFDGPEVPDYQFAVIAMGRLGGAEIGYSSDADVMFVYRGMGELDDEARARLAAHVKKVALGLKADLGKPGPWPQVEIDPDLRPEGKNGPLVRTLESYAAYYGKWSEPWEAQALLRARPVAGDEQLAQAYLDLITPLRYPAHVDENSLRQMRKLKARMENERLPRNADPKRHLKLGTGGLSDVEWTVQLTQLLHAHEYPDLRTTSTRPALKAAADAGLIAASDAKELDEAWTLATNVRSAVVLYRGRAAESLPAKPFELEATARLLGYPPDSWQRFQDDFLRAGRHARKVMERLFFGFED